MSEASGHTRRALIIAVCVLLACTMKTTATEGSTTVLAFGGNGFIGSEVVSKMIERNYKIFLVSRGNWYFDSEERIKPHVIPVVCDREKGIQSCEELMRIINETKHFDYVLDFSGYTPQVVAKAVTILGTKVGVYLYISTDSIYEVCKPSEITGSTVEDDAVRPTDEHERARLNEIDTYGDEKLAGEEVSSHKLRALAGF